MKYKFVLLRFENDANIAGKVYWYSTGLNLLVGDKVLAPVGMHDRLQEGIVTQVVEREPKDAPYDVSLVKSVMCRSGTRTLEIDSVKLFEFGGARYDEKHFTPFGRVVYAKEMPHSLEGLRFYGVVHFIPEDEEEPFEVISRSRGGVLLSGKRGEEVFRALLHLVRGEEDPLLKDVDETTRKFLKEKLL